MIYRTLSSLTESLINKPESGMGYQIIEAKPSNKYSSSQFVIYNAELIVELNSDFNYYKSQIVTEGYRKILRDSSLLNLYEVSLTNKRAFNEPIYLSESKRNENGRHSGGKAAKESDPKYANGSDVFVRLSAYENDRRIDETNKKLKPGSYTTTYDDYIICKHFNDDPVDRYALPNDEEIKWAFHIQPKSYDSYRPGIVQPDFGHSGGGIEALFDNGTSNNTYLKKERY